MCGGGGWVGTDMCIGFIPFQDKCEGEKNPGPRKIQNKYVCSAIDTETDWVHVSPSVPLAWGESRAENIGGNFRWVDAFKLRSPLLPLV